ncbi:hypothetical protein ANO11243_038390 [Dothideomycetidae sp. 11243]|nr:hypothetical protein ANO11243_038390 [fungal sp. No.11243]
MARTTTSSQPSFTRPGSVTYIMPKPAAATTTPSEAATKVTIHIPPGSDWTSGLHYHATHTEFLRVKSGQASVRLGSTTKIYTSSEGIIRVERGQWHEWKRAAADGEELVVEEWTDPADGQKELFFRNLNSVILDAGASRPWWLVWVPVGWWIEWQIMVICAGLDNFPVVEGASASGRLATGLGEQVARLFGAVVGLRAIYPEYTPDMVAGETKKRV